MYHQYRIHDILLKDPNFSISAFQTEQVHLPKLNQSTIPAVMICRCQKFYLIYSRIYHKSHLVFQNKERKEVAK